MIVDPNVCVGAASVVGTRVKNGGCVIVRIILGSIIDTVLVCRFVALIWKTVPIAVAVRMYTLGKAEVEKDKYNSRDEHN